MLSDLQNVLGTLFSWMSGIYSLYISGGILTGVFMLWLLKRVSRLFHKI